MWTSQSAVAFRWRRGNAYTRQFGSQFQPLGQSVWPIKHWVPGKFYADDFIIDVPAGWPSAGFSISFECQPL